MINILKERFNNNMKRHINIIWDDVEKKIESKAEILNILQKMEDTGGEPDVIGLTEDGRIIICDCSKETPIKRRSLCYDEKALKSRTKNPPCGDAISLAKEIGINILNEELYFRLQSLDEFDLKTSSWIETPNYIREKGGALFCEKRYGKIFVFHNSADSYYSVRGFRGYLLV